MQPSELEAMEYYEFHYLVKDLLEFLKKENESNTDQQDQTNSAMSGMKLPNMKMPNISMPKM